jgi:hypothetical protein
VLEDFPEDAPDRGVGLAQPAEGWACPVSVAVDSGEGRDDDGLLPALRREVMGLRPWYDLSVERRGRTSVAYFASEAAFRFLSTVLRREPPDFPESISTPSVALRLAAQDLKAFYFESVSAKPGLVPPEAAQFNRWFWQETAAGRVLKAVKAVCGESEDQEMKNVGLRFLVPLDQA